MAHSDGCRGHGGHRTPRPAAVGTVVHQVPEPRPRSSPRPRQPTAAAPTSGPGVAQPGGHDAGAAGELDPGPRHRARPGRRRRRWRRSRGPPNRPRRPAAGRAGWPPTPPPGRPACRRAGAHRRPPPAGSRPVAARIDGPGRLGLEAAPRAAAHRPPVGLDDHVADVAGVAGRPRRAGGRRARSRRPTPVDTTMAMKLRDAPGRADPALAQRQGLGVVVDVDRQAGQLGQAAPAAGSPATPGCSAATPSRRRAPSGPPQPTPTTASSPRRTADDQARQHVPQLLGGPSDRASAPRAGRSGTPSPSTRPGGQLRAADVDRQRQLRHFLLLAPGSPALRSLARARATSRRHAGLRPLTSSAAVT